MKTYFYITCEQVPFGTSLCFTPSCIGYSPSVWHHQNCSTCFKNSYFHVSFEHSQECYKGWCHILSLQGGSDEVHHSELFHNQTFPAHLVTFPPKICVPVSLWNILTCSAPRSVWASCFREKLTDEGKFCKCLYSFEEWGSRICTFLFLSYQILHIFLWWCEEIKIFLSQEQTLIFVVLTKLSCPLQT